MENKEHTHCKRNREMIEVGDLVWAVSLDDDSLRTFSQNIL